MTLRLRHVRGACLALACGWGLAVLGVGCGPPAAPASPLEAEHLEHHVPPHRPVSFAAGLVQVRQRVRELDEATNGQGHEDLPTRVTELAEILEWLPELALDSDIRRRDWEEIHRVAGALLSDYRKAQREGPGGLPGGGLETRFHDRLVQLERLAPQVQEDSVPHAEPRQSAPQPEPGSR
ncbi:MAG: hypothetical protein ACKOFW_03155 [Planctomycetaceae bacterium]